MNTALPSQLPLWRCQGKHTWLLRLMIYIVSYLSSVHSWFPLDYSYSRLPLPLPLPYLYSTISCRDRPSSEEGHTTVHYTTVHYTTLHYTTLHYTTLHYTTLQYSTHSTYIIVVIVRMTTVRTVQYIHIISLVYSLIFIQYFIH